MNSVHHCVRIQVVCFSVYIKLDHYSCSIYFNLVSKMEWCITSAGWPISAVGLPLSGRLCFAQVWWKMATIRIPIIMLCMRQMSHKLLTVSCLRPRLVEYQISGQWQSNGSSPGLPELAGRAQRVL